MKKFIDELSTAVITTKYIIEKTSPISSVSHFDEGTGNSQDQKQNCRILIIV
jgi:hypothetical protein